MKKNFLIKKIKIKTQPQLKKKASTNTERILCQKSINSTLKKIISLGKDNLIYEWHMICGLESIYIVLVTA